MKLTLRGTMAFGAQDGAFWGDYLFRFNADGSCRVFDAHPLDGTSDTPVDLPLITAFHTDPADPVVPHFNAVDFAID